MRERKHRNYGEILNQRKTENEEMMQSLSTAKQRLLTQVREMLYWWPHANENGQSNAQKVAENDEETM